MNKDYSHVEINKIFESINNDFEKIGNDFNTVMSDFECIFKGPAGVMSSNCISKKAIPTLRSRLLAKCGVHTKNWKECFVENL